MSYTDWFSPDWFMPSTFSSYTWEHPIFLHGLWLLPLLWLLYFFIRKFLQQPVAVAVLKQEWKFSATVWMRFIPDVLVILTTALLLIALARPQRTKEKVEQWSEGIDIMIALDISQSMQIEDFQPNRLKAAKEVAKKFIAKRKNDRIGLVIFSGDAFSLSPLTTDHELLRSYINDVAFDMIDARGTAIGSALAVVTNRMRESTAKSKVCILISDGDNTSGNIDPITASELASAYSIKLYTILVGREGLVPMGKDFFGQPNMIDNTVDETTMRRIATIGQGEFFRVTDNQAFKKVFDKIDQYEREEIKETRYKDATDFYTVYLKWAVLFWLLWLLLKSTFVSNALQD